MADNSVVAPLPMACYMGCLGSFVKRAATESLAIKITMF